MSRSRKSPADKQSGPTVSVDALFREGDIEAAVRVATRFHEQSPGPASLQLYRQTLVRAAQYYADHRILNKFLAIYALAERQTADADWTVELATLQAKGWSLSRALALVKPLEDPAVTARITAVGVDRAVRTQEKDALPTHLHEGFDAIISAFQAYEREQDDQARTLLQSIGLQSPFLEWKLLLRGLLAEAAAENSRALENWQRLSPDRLPYRLVIPFLAQLDMSVLSKLPEQEQAQIERQIRKLNSNNLLSQLQKLQNVLVTGISRESPYKMLEAAVPLLRQEAPHLLPALANVFYNQIGRKGSPRDFNKHRQFFGPPPEDPNFDRLQAIVLEQLHDFNDSLRHWAAYEAWLAKGSIGWPKAIVDCARAHIWHTMGTLAKKSASYDELMNDRFEELMIFSTVPKQTKLEKGSPLADPSYCYEKALELSPDWLEPALALFEHYKATNRPDEAEATARKLLEHKPNSIEMLLALAELLLSEGRPAEALEYTLRYQTNNPLNSEVRKRCALGYFALAQRQGIEGDYAAVEATLLDSKGLCEEYLSLSVAALRSVIARKKGDSAEADKQAAIALAQPSARLAALFALFVNSFLLLLKPAIKNAAKTTFLEAIGTTPTPGEIIALNEQWTLITTCNLNFTGQKIQFTKFIEACVKAARSKEETEREFEQIVAILEFHKKWKQVMKVALDLTSRFPKNPYFCFLYVVGSYFLSPSKWLGQKAEYFLMKARQFAKGSSEKRHQDLIPRIDEFLSENDLDRYEDL